MRTTKELNSLPKKDLRELFLKLTDHVKMKGIKYDEQARILAEKSSTMSETRMKNIRLQSGAAIAPYVQEVADFQTVFAKELRQQHIVILDRAIEAARAVRDDPEAAETFRRNYVQ